MYYEKGFIKIIAPFYGVFTGFGCFHLGQYNLIKS